MQRQQFLESRGLTVIRFNDAAVKVYLNNVLMAIEGRIERNNPPAPFSKGELPTHFEKEPKNYAPLWQRGGRGDFINMLLIASSYFSIDTERRNWSELYHKGVIDKREYYRNKFRFF
jgi:hypothetical protein